MRQAERFFAGGNTARGFFSCYEQLFADRQRVFYVKGGPGVGKSSLMRQMGEAYEEAGQAVRYFHCSSDPDSLDGIAVDALGVAMLDATAPHRYDPALPGARDTLLSLGDFLDEKQLAPKRKELERLQGEISGRFERAYAYLGGAERVLAAASRGHERTSEVVELTDELCERFLPLRGGYGAQRRFFAAAYTCKGRVELLGTVPRDTAVVIETPLGQTADGLLRALDARARARGLQTTLLLDPLRPDIASHLSLAQHSLLFTTDSVSEPTLTIAAERLFALDARTEREMSFDKNACELMELRAMEQLKAAKALHDELESYYIAHMDFLRWEKLLKRLRQELGV